MDPGFLCSLTNFKVDNAMLISTKTSDYRPPLCEEGEESAGLPICTSGDGQTESYVDSGTEFSW